MDERRKERLEEVARILKSISHPVRMFVVEELAGGRKCASDLAEKAGIGLPALSYHLRLMREADVIAAHRDRKWILFSLRNGTVQALDRLRNSLETVLSGKTRRLKTLCRTASQSVPKERRRSRASSRFLAVR